MSGHWVYTPRTLPPRVLFPEPSQEQNEETASPSENDDPAGVTPVRDRFCLQRRLCCEDDEATVHNCEVCDTDIGLGICKGCNGFLCYGCCYNPDCHGCEGLVCDECGFISCSRCCYAALPSLKEGYIGSTGIFGCPPGGCESCCLLWADWIERHKGLQTPAASPFCKRDVFARLFCTLTPKTETRVGKRQTPLGSDQSCGPLGHCQRRLKLDDTDGSGDGDAQEGAAECNTELPQKRQKRPRMEESADGDSCMSCEELSTSGRHPHTPLSHGQTSSSVGGSPDAVLHSPSPSVAQGSGCLQPLEGFAGPGRTGKAREGCDVLQPIMGLTPVNSPDDPVGGLLCSTDKSTVHEPRGRGPNKGGSDASIYRRTKRVSCLVTIEDVGAK